MESITITKAEFDNAVIEANKKFRECTDKETDGDSKMVQFMMELQNMAFGAAIYKILFKEESVETPIN